jgi:hypothetical protein
MIKRSILIGAVALLFVACSNASNSDATSTTADNSATSTEPGDSTTVKPPPKAPNIDLSAPPEWFQNEDAAPSGLVETIATELGASYTGSMAVNWSTNGLGCGSGGTELQVITPGYVIYYEGVGGPIRVHAAENGRWLECGLEQPLRGTPVLNS